MNVDSRAMFRAALLFILLGASGCNQDSAPAGTTATASPASSASPISSSRESTTGNAALVADDPCRLLTDAEVQALIPGTKGGARDRAREEFGIRTCAWQTPSGHFAVQEWELKSGTLDNEIRGLMEGVLDPGSSTAHDAIRYESIPGVGDEAFAVVEGKDDKRGILSNVAVLVARRGTHLFEIDSSDLAQRERAGALQSLAALGKTAAPRL